MASTDQKISHGQFVAGLLLSLLGVLSAQGAYFLFLLVGLPATGIVLSVTGTIVSVLGLLFVSRGKTKLGFSLIIGFYIALTILVNLFFSLPGGYLGFLK